MKTVKISPTYTFVVDYSLSFHEMKEPLNISCYSPLIDPLFYTNIKGKGIRAFEAKIWRFRDHLRAVEIIGRIKAHNKKNPWKVARVEHLLAFGAKYPEVQMNLPRLVALGKPVMSWHGLEVAFLHRLAEDRWLWNTNKKGLHSSDCNFLAVREIKKPRK